MKTMQAATEKVQETKRETQQDTYRTPRLVTLGTAVGLVQGGTGSIYETYGRYSVR